VATQARRIEPARAGGYIPAMNVTTLAPVEAEPLAILIAPHPALKRRTLPVRPEQFDQVRAMAPRMFEVMYRAPGIGLAAPQIGSPLRFAVVDLMPDDKRVPMVLVNPEIIAASEEQSTREEGCLSLPGMYADVTRPARVTVRYQDQNGVRHDLQADGLLAACLQHEIDHLDGVLFVDHLSVLKRNMIMRRLAKEQRKGGK
jgi:peptide deformylase